MLVLRIHPLAGYTSDKRTMFIARMLLGNLTYICFTAVYRLLPLGIGATVIATNPFLIALLQAFILADRPSLVEVAGICISFGGIVLMSLSHNIDPESDQHAEYVLGIGMAVATSVGVALSTITSRLLKGFDTNALMFNHMLCGTLMSIALIPFDKKPTPYFVYERNSTYALLVVAGLANNAAMTLL